ncbi:hypothetical protein ZIOFF_012098 [Zingiber officinale]|uniref:TPX2 C-terminal domain-containing protein n=2 Tax=Zingiber officinale TaxID=94328 RepID=A0A8J5HRU4_ZINOF|nr:hypothetical protein ZIOFF_012098 [Zingiber officinale]
MAELFCGGAIGERGSSGYESEERWPPEKLGLCREGGYLDAPVTGQYDLVMKFCDSCCGVAEYLAEMESGDGVEMELSKGTPETSPEANGFSSQINKENEIVENGADAVPASSGSEDTSKVEVPDFSRDSHEVSESARENNGSLNPIKKGGSDECSQFKKTKKNFGVLNGSVGELNEKRKALSQSSSFPSKGSLNTTTLTRQTRIASSKTNGHLTAKTTTSSVQKTLAVNKGSGEVIISDKSARNGTSIKDGKSYDIKEKLSDSSLSTKNDEDAHSNASSTTPRAIKGTGCGFNFRLDERAEKRKEFFMKLEEKNHAKELEKTNLDAKSQENREAEIRRLRKSLNFKATPMPSFYQEPTPPKIELKKIPPTRPKSPRLGRRKSSTTATDNPLEAVDSSENSTKSNGISATSKGNANAMASKNPKPKTLAKLPSPKSTTTRSDTKSSAADKHASNQKPMVEVLQIDNHAVTSSLEDKTEGDKAVANLAESEIVPQQVSVLG